MSEKVKLAKPVCVCCGAGDAVVSVQLDEFTGEDTVFHCDSCDQSFSMELVEQTMATWAGWIGWLKSHPGYTPAE